MIKTPSSRKSRLLLRDRGRVSYAPRAATDNTEMESFNRRFTSENRALFLDARTLSALWVVVRRGMDYYNNP